MYTLSIHRLLYTNHFPHWFGLHFDTKNDMLTRWTFLSRLRPSPVRYMEIFSYPRLAMILIESVTEKIWNFFASAGYDANSEAYSRILIVFSPLRN
jgi:hypothetical protein